MSVLLGALLLGVVGFVLAVLLSPRVLRAELWRATATPLASIIGSGFLVVAPLLWVTVGRWAPVAMAAIVAVAWALGATIRYSITHLEPVLEADPPKAVAVLARLGDVALTLAYIVSVAFYVRLLSSFVLHELAHAQLAEQILTTVVLAAIGIVGASRGLTTLERLETVAVGTKLSIIAALLVGLVVHDSALWWSSALQIGDRSVGDPWHAVRVLAGLLLVVQGFETSRYLGGEYSAPVRVRTMRAAQAASGLIYIAFVGLMVPLAGGLGEVADETAIIALSGQVHALLPMLLVVAAVMSQFSAAVADTIGAGGLGHELLRRLDPRRVYPVVVGLAIALTWTADIFQVIAHASRAFALYYAVQCALAAWAAHPRSVPRACAFSVLGLLMLGVVVIAIPAG